MAKYARDIPNVIKYALLEWSHSLYATCNGGNITISSDAIRESSECITDSTRTPSIVENIVGANH
jgi:hypothetical protein